MRTVRVLMGAAVVAQVLVAGGARAAWQPMCEHVVASPAFGRDRTAFCVFSDTPGGVQHLAVTTDGLRTWERAAAAGLRRDAGTGLSVVLSPQHADPRLFVTVSTGTYVSTDRGATFTLLDPLATDARLGNPSAFLAKPALPSPVVTDPLSVHLFYVDERSAARIDADRRLHQPGAGAAGVDLLGFVGTKWTLRPYGLGYRRSDGRAVSLACDESLTCSVAFEFPAGMTFGAGRELWARPAPNWRSMLVRVYDSAGDVHTWRSGGGPSFSVWPEVERLLAPVNRATAGRPLATVAGDYSLPRLAYLRVSAPGLTAPGAPPAEQLFHSTDMGATWRRVGFAANRTGRGGGLPWRGPAAGVDGAGLYGAHGHFLLALGTGHGGAGTVFCSADGGRHWSRSC